MDQIHAELAPFIEATPMGPDDFSGHRTRRTGSLIARSPSFRPLATHPLVIGTLDQVLGDHATSYQLHLTQVIDIGPGEPGSWCIATSGRSTGSPSPLATRSSAT